MELVKAGMAEIVPNCDIEQNSSSDTQSQSSSSFSTGRLPCGTASYNPAGQFCVDGSVYELCNGNEYAPATQFCYLNTVKNGWRSIKGEDIWYSPSSDPWFFNNEVGSLVLNSGGGVKFSAVSGSDEGYFLQLSQDGHNLKAGDCYFIGAYGSTNAGSRAIQFGFQEIGGSYTGYWAYDFTFSTYRLYESYAYIDANNTNARFYINAGYNSASTLTITDLAIKKIASNANKLLCEDGYYDN